MCSSLRVVSWVVEGSQVVSAFVFGGGVGVYLLCWQKCWYARQGWGRGVGSDVLVFHRTIEFRLKYALFIVENVHTSHFELVMYLSYYCSLKS